MIELGIALVVGFGLGYAARSYLSHGKRLHATKYRGLDQGPIW